jgi:dihydrolipoamide dehydrogenase
MTPSRTAEQAAGDRIGRHRHRVRQLLQRYGREVTVVEMMDRIVPVEDADVSAFLEKAVKKQGMTILTGAGVEKHRRIGQGRGEGAIKGKDGKVSTGEFSHVIVAVGIVPNTENIGLEAGRQGRSAGSSSDRRFWPHQCQGVWAIGDVTKAPGLRTRPATKA